jgi:hypothetical protein
MKCPYACNAHQVNQNRYEYDEDGRNTFHEHKLVEKKQFLDCLQEECAVWIDGRCNYNQGHNGD